MYNFIRTHKLRITCWGAVVLLMLFVAVPSCLLFYLFDASKVKQTLIHQFNNNDYHITINGNITPEFWQGFSIKIDDLSIANKDNMPLLHLGNVNCKLSWLYLAFAKFKVDEIIIQQLNVSQSNVIRYGVSNLLNLSTSSPPLFNHLSELRIKDINMVGDNIPYDITDGTMRVSMAHAPADFAIGFKLKKNNTYVVINGEINDVNNQQLTFNNFNIHAYNAALKVNLMATTTYQIKKNQLVLNNVTGDIKFHNHAGTVAMNTLSFSNQHAIAKNAIINLNLGNEIAKQELHTVFHQIDIMSMQQIAIDSLQLQYLADLDDNHLNLKSNLGQINIDESYNVTSNSCMNHIIFSAKTLLHNTLDASLSGICEYINTNQLLNFNLQGTLDHAPIKIDLQLLTSTPKPKLILAGKIDNLDLSRVTVGTDKFLPFYYDNSDLPFAWLSLIDMNANLLIKNFALDRITLNQVATDFTIADNQLKVKSLTANMYNGVLVAFGKLAKDGSIYNMETHATIKNLDLQSMFEDLFDVRAISGKANMHMDILANNVVSYNELHKKLNGTVTIDANHGAFAGVDFNLFATPQPITLATQKLTKFQGLNANFQFIDGISKHGSLNFYSPLVITNGSGNVNFVDTTLDYNLTIKSTLPQNTQKISTVIIPVRASGDLFNPQITIQNIHLSTSKTKFLRKRSTNKLNSHSERHHNHHQHKI